MWARARVKNHILGVGKLRRCRNTLIHRDEHERPDANSHTRRTNAKRLRPICFFSPFRCIVHFCESKRKSLQRNFVFFFFCYLFCCFYKLFCLQSYFSFFALSLSQCFSRVVLPPYALKYVCVCSIHAFTLLLVFMRVRWRFIIFFRTFVPQNFASVQTNCIECRKKLSMYKSYEACYRIVEVREKDILQTIWEISRNNDIHKRQPGILPTFGQHQQISDRIAFTGAPLLPDDRQNQYPSPVSSIRINCWIAPCGQKQEDKSLQLSTHFPWSPLPHHFPWQLWYQSECSSLFCL